MVNAYELINETSRQPIIITCEHASGDFPKEYGTLGVDPAVLSRVSDWYDIGAKELSMCLATHLGAQCLFGRFSRLLIDLNRDVNHEQLIRTSSFGVAVPANKDLSPEERQKRINRFYQPYHKTLAAHIAALTQHHPHIILFSVHSFNHVLDTVTRDVDIGLLYQNDTHQHFCALLKKMLTRESSFDVRFNEPYSAKELGTRTIRVYDKRPNITSVVLEISDRYLKNEHGVRAMCSLLTKGLTEAMMSYSKMKESGPDRI